MSSIVYSGFGAPVWEGKKKYVRHTTGKYYHNSVLGMLKLQVYESTALSGFYFLHLLILKP